MPGEGESGLTAKPWNIRVRVNRGASAGKARAKREGESGLTAKPSNLRSPKVTLGSLFLPCSYYRVRANLFPSATKVV
jgi:hypothetical protein